MSGSKLAVLILTAAAGATLCAFVVAGPITRDVAGLFGHHHGAPRQGVPQLVKELGLSEQQAASVRGVMDRHRDEWKAAKLQVADARAALRAVVQTQPLNEGAVRSAADGLGRAIGDRAVLRGRVGSEVRQFLTGDQAARLDALRAEREARRTGTREKAAER